MRLYSVHVPQSDSGGGSPLDRAVFVRDGFGWPAFLFGPFWCLAQRLWLEAVALTAVEFGLVGLGHALHLRPETVAFCLGLVAFLVGLEAASLRRWKLGRRGFADRGTVVAHDLAEAERLFFGRAMTAEAAMPTAGALPAPPAGPAPGREPQDVIGLFPEAGRSR